MSSPFDYFGRSATVKKGEIRVLTFTRHTMAIYQAMYNPMTWESAPVTISIHLSREGAEAAIAAHKGQKRKEWQLVVDSDEDKGTDMGHDKLCPFGQFEDWFIQETELLP